MICMHIISMIELYEASTQTPNTHWT